MKLKDLFTGKDNLTPDIGRVSFAVSLLVYYFLSYLETRHGHDFSPIEFATGLGLIASGFGVLFNLKSNTEPDSIKPPTSKTP